MTHLVFLVEERSVGPVIDAVLPTIVAPGVTFQVVTHQGKQDLEKSIPRKLRAWRTPGTSFVVVRDKDSADCVALKARLSILCREAGRPDTLVRIVCTELESWFLGDLAALEGAFRRTGLAARAGEKKFRDPDALANAAEELRKIVPEYQKLSGARAVAPHLRVEANRSRSFRVFVDGVRRVAGVTGSADDETA